MGRLVRCIAGAAHYRVSVLWDSVLQREDKDFVKDELKPLSEEASPPLHGREEGWCMPACIA